MKNYDEKFYLYLKNKMSDKERIIFEDDLNKSELLKNDFEEYKNITHLITESKNIKINKDYLESIVPEFRRKLEQKQAKKSSKNLKYMFATVVIIIAGYVVVSQFNTENNQELNQALTELSNDEIDFITDDFYVSDDLTKNIDDESSSKIYSIYTENLKASFDESFSEINSSRVLSTYKITDVDKYLTDDEMELIYSELIEKKIL